ncbi:hypothetical protein M422DRAFT_781953 [Sphaerobolus stellatus SS14]|uniref:PCI domain-containing protein n=1 Tax=Sphaerobolus stellatus (strain SS14) TaxID=990650 RepID=A0A0C9VHS9_SPHS4|nr:hypothetical protein M422DRAFT_781953 [Sphaerobolus stellatus SS14]
MATPATARYLSRAATAFSQRQGHKLVPLLTPDLKNPEIEQIVQELAPENINIRKVVLRILSEDDQSRLADLMGTVLRYIRDTAMVEEGGQIELLKSLRMSKIYESASKLYGAPDRDTGWFNPCIQQLTFRLLEESIKADDTREDNSRDRFVASITTASNGPLKTAASDTRSLNALHTITPRPRDIVFWLANLLLRCSFELRDTLASAEPILTYLSPQMDKLPMYSRAEQVTFHYYAGSVFLIKEELRPARDHLKLAFDLCTNKCFNNKRLIFINLVTVSILLGIFPRLEVLNMFGLTNQFLPLINAIKLGDRSAFRYHLDTNMEWFRHRFIYLILRSKGEILVLRSLFRRAVLISNILWPDNSRKTVRLEHLLVAVRFSFRYSAMGDMDLSTWDLLDIEALCASLIDQGYIQGYLLHSGSRLVVSKSNTFGFPLVSSVVVRNDD